MFFTYASHLPRGVGFSLFSAPHLCTLAAILLFCLFGTQLSFGQNNREQVLALQRQAMVCSSFWQICCGMLCTGAWADYPSMNCRCICADLPFIFVFYTACGNRTGSARRSIHYVCRVPAVRWYFRTGRCIRFSVLSRCTASWRTRSLFYILWHKLPSVKLYRGCPPFGSRSCFCASSSRPYTGLTHSFTPITCFYSCRLPVLRS